jgi:hypothetical protein
MTDREQADLLRRAIEGGAFDAAGTAWRLAKAARPGERHGEHEQEIALREVETFLGEELKIDTVWRLFLAWDAWKRFETGSLSAVTPSFWALRAADEAFGRRREARLRRRAAQRRSRRKKEKR